MILFEKCNVSMNFSFQFYSHLQCCCVIINQHFDSFLFVCWFQCDQRDYLKITVCTCVLLPLKVIIHAIHSHRSITLDSHKLLRKSIASFLVTQFINGIQFNRKNFTHKFVSFLFFFLQSNKKKIISDNEIIDESFFFFNEKL